MRLLLGVTVVIGLFALVVFGVRQLFRWYIRHERRRFSAKVSHLPNECDMFINLLRLHRTITISQLRREMREWYPRLEVAEIDTIAAWAHVHGYCSLDLGRDDVYYATLQADRHRASIGVDADHVSAG